MYLKRRNRFLRACALGALPTVESMLEAGEDIDQMDQDGNNAVSIAIVNHNLPLLKLLAKRNTADMTRMVDKPSGNMFFPVELAIMSGFTEGLRFMVDEVGVPLQSAQMRGRNMLLFHALQTAAQHPDALRYLVEEKHLNPRHARFNDNYNLLHKAEDEDADPAIVEYLLRKGVDPECRNARN